MATYKMIYADARGRAETIRLMFAEAGVEFEDVRIAMQDIQATRDETPYGILPVLHTEGKIISGNATIVQYLGGKLKLGGENDLENSEIMSIVDCTEDVWIKMIAYFYESNPERKAELNTRLLQCVPPSLMKLEKKVQINGDPSGWIYGSKRTFADFAIFALLDVLQQHVPVLDKFAGLQKLYNSVKTLPRVADWLEKRPQTDQ